MAQAIQVRNRSLRIVRIPVGFNVAKGTPECLVLPPATKTGKRINQSETLVPSPIWSEAKKHRMVRGMLTQGDLVEGSRVAE